MFLNKIRLKRPVNVPLESQARGGDGFEASCGALLYVESFDTDASVWPLPWLELADSAEVADVVAGEARLRPVPSGNPYPLARMAADVSTTDVDVRFRLRMDDASRNGVGFYVRQNGGDNTTLRSSFLGRKEFALIDKSRL